MVPKFAYNPTTNYDNLNQYKSKIIVVDMSTILHPTNQDLLDNYPEYLDYIQNQLNKICMQFTTTNILLVWEYTKSDYRINLNPDYKAGRKPKHDNFKEYVEKLFYDIGNQYPSLGIEGVESDDIIAELATLSHENLEVIIVSVDRDLLQLLDQPNVKMFDFPRKQLFTKETLCDFKIMNWRGFTPKDILPYKLVAGDKSDNITACANRVGPKTAMELYNKYGDPRNWTKETFEYYTGKNKAQIIDFIENKLALHINLMELPNSEVLNYKQKCYISDILNKCMNNHIKRLKSIRDFDVDVSEYRQTGKVEYPTFMRIPTRGVCEILKDFALLNLTKEIRMQILLKVLTHYNIKHLKEYPQFR